MITMCQKTRAEEIQEAISSFTKTYFDEELEMFSCNLLSQVQKNRKLNIFKGDVKVWAAAIIYVLARFNSLFNVEDKRHIHPQWIGQHFGVDKQTLIRRADRIEQASHLEFGEPSISSLQTRSMLHFFKTSSGFVIPKLSIDTCLLNIGRIDALEAEWLKHKVEQKIMAEKEKQRQRWLEKAKNKSRSKVKQLDLFQNVKKNKS